MDVNVAYFESQNSYSIQAADFIANAVNTKYEYNYNYFYNIIKHRIVQSERFPRRYFGTDNIIEINKYR